MTRQRLATEAPLQRPSCSAGARRLIPVALLILAALASPAQAERVHSQHRSLADTRITWPTGEQVLRVLTLRDYNTRVVLLGTVSLGLASGFVGTFMLLRRRALVGDVVSHCSLPGIAIAFLIGESIRPGLGRSLPLLLVGALVAGLVGVFCASTIRQQTRIKEDAALAIVLSIFFGIGIALFTIIQNIPSGSQAGLNQFIFGKAALMTAGDVRLIGQAAVVALVLCTLLFKEFALLCFDERYAVSQGWPVRALDAALTGLVVVVTVIGLQSVGLLLVVAMLIVPAAAARFWTDHLPRMAAVSSLFGGLGAALGVLASAMMPRLAAGAIIVLVGSLLFVASLVLGTRRGLLRRTLIQWNLRRRIGRLDLLRAIYEHLELQAGDPSDDGFENQAVETDALLAMRTWSRPRLGRLMADARRKGLLRLGSDGGWLLTSDGVRRARLAVRNHRLWELYLIHFADIAPSHVDRDADQIEHVLGPALVEELEQLLARRASPLPVPPSPHQIDDFAASPP